jgi:hypothetical protein
MSQTAIAAQPRERAKRLRPLTVPIGALRALADAVGGQHRDLSQHVACQEGPPGLFALLVTAAPRYRNMVEHLRGDHQHLSRAVAALRMKILRALPSQFETLAAEAAAIAAAISEHDALEREMLRDALG